MTWNRSDRRCPWRYTTNIHMYWEVFVVSDSTGADEEQTEENKWQQNDRSPEHNCSDLLSILNLRYVVSKDQSADLGTKSCPWPQRQRMRPRLYVKVQLVSGDYYYLPLSTDLVCVQLIIIEELIWRLLHRNTQNYSGGESVVWVI